MLRFIVIGSRVIKGIGFGAFWALVVIMAALITKDKLDPDSGRDQTPSEDK